MRKRFLYIFVIVAILLTFSLPTLTGYSLTSSGTFYQDMNSGVPGATYRVINGYVKYNYHPGALLSRYYFVDSAGGTYFAYPIRAPISNYGDEVQGRGGYEISWTSAMNGGNLMSVVPQCYGAVIGFRNTCNGPVTGYGTITATYSTLFKAYAYILKYGYGGANDMGAAFGLGSSASDQAAKYYATNMAMQRLSSQSMINYDMGGYGTDGVADLRVTNFSYYLENAARKILCSGANLFSNLQGSVGTPTRLNSSTVNVPITVSIPANENIAYYSNYTDFYWADLSNMNCPNASAVASALSYRNGARTISANLQITSNSIKGGERIAYYIQGKTATSEALGRIFITSGGNIQAYILSDPSSIGSTTIVQLLNQVFVAGYLPKFDTISSTITTKTSYTAGEIGTISVVYTNNSALPAVNVPVSLSCSSSAGIPFAITNPNQTIGELLAGASTTVTYSVKANTLTANATATLTSKIGYNTDSSTRFNETNYTNNTSTKTTTVYSMPDLVVDSVLTDKEPTKTYEAGETIKITATVTNIGYLPTTNSVVRLSQVTPDSMQPVGFDQGTAPAAIPYFDQTIGALAPGASTTVTWDFVTPIRLEAKTVNATVTADATNLIAEMSETNNTQTIALTLNPGMPDFNASVYNMDSSTVLTAGYDAVVSAWIGNTGKISSSSVDVSMTINGQTYTENICVPTATRNYPTGNHPLGGNLASFRFHVPDTPGTYEITIKADPESKIAEENENNNNTTITVTVQAETMTPMIDAGSSALKSNYNGSTAKPSYTSTNSLAWNEVLQTGTKTYETVSYSVSLTTDFILSPGDYVAYPESERADVIESGFGLEADATVSLTSNCSDPDKLVGPQYLYVYYPETNYGNSTNSGFESYHETMERISGTEYSGVWALQENPFSSLEYPRVHYTPLWYPDGQYTAVCMALNSWTPAGKLSYGTEDSVIISGDMYDRVSVVAR